MEAQLQHAKFEELAAVQRMLKTSLGDTNKETHCLLEKVDKITLNEILTGKIKKYKSLKKSIFTNYELLNELKYTTYSLLIKKQINRIDKATPFIFNIESIFIR